MSEFTLSIDRSDMAGDLDPLVIHGTRETGWCVMPGWQLPGEDVNVTHATSPVTDGGVATHATAAVAIMSGDVLLNVDDAADRTAAVAELKAALRRLAYTVTVTWNGVDEDWLCNRASIVPSPLDYISVDRDMPIYTLTIPCPEPV
jgi:alpha-D-ribose 1-methylphosphonate 5-phosphate C-P lyase